MLKETVILYAKYYASGGLQVNPYILELKNIQKQFGTSDVLKGIGLSVAHGEFVTLLGSSGCGKTTTLRIIAGLENCDSGAVLLEGKDVTHEPPERRSVTGPKSFDGLLTTRLGEVVR